MNIAAADVKKLREISGVGIMDCKEALKESKGEFEEALKVLRKKGLASASKKASRKTEQGLIASYIHLGGKLGVLVEINCETDFVAKTDEYKELVKNIAMQIAAANPICISREDVPEEVVKREKDIYMSQFKDKPEKIAEKIALGKMEKFYEENCLIDQAFVKDPNMKIKDYITQKIAEIGENIKVRRFTRYQLGEEDK